MRRFFAIFVAVLLVIVLVLGGFVFYLRGSLPKIKGTLRLEGLNGNVEIVRDADGVPHIFAATDHDAYFALGYVHAQDRMWQMEMQRRIGAGRLSEILGEAALDIDKFLRTLGTHRAAKESWPAISEESRAVLEAYATGVNTWIDERHVLPPEFLLLGVKPEPWTVHDSLVWAKMMAWDLGGNYDMELLRVRLVQAIGAERASELLAPFPQDGTTILSTEQIPAQAADALLAQNAYLQSNLQLGGQHVGSNSWAVSGSRTASGLPILANDPHLGARMPSIWYLAEVQGDRLHATGATFPGLPAVVIGHNEHIVWSATNLGPDVQDLYIERTNPRNPNQYEVEGEWVDMQIVSEEIRVKGWSEPILWAARSTRHGPLISDVTSAPMPVALRWTALDPGDATLDSFLGISYARNWDEFTAALEGYVAPCQNIVYADVEGNIGYYAPGRIPIRAQGDGTLPVPGWASEYEWTGWIPFEDMPHVLNPESGYVVTANNRAVPDDYPYFITYDWADPYRAERIVERIEALSDPELSLSDMMGLQADQYSTQVRELLPLLLQIEAADDRQAQALELLQSWDGVASLDSVAATIYEAWYRQLGPAIFEDDLSGDLYNSFAERYHATFLVDVLSDDENTWCDNLLTTPVEGCADTARTALARALEDLEERGGRNMTRWRWGRFHRTQYPHNPLSEVKALRGFFHREIANGGNANTVNVAPSSYEQPYLQFHVPSYRQVVDLGDLNKSVFIHTTGQSGNPLSVHYDDMIERHQAVEYLPMTFGRDRVSGSVLVLEPR